MSSQKWNILMLIFIVGVCMQSIYGIVQFFMQEIPAVSWLGISHHAPWILGDAVVENFERRWLRAYGSFPHPNILAAYLVVGYFFCITVVMRSKEKMQTWLATLAGVCILFALVLTFSREAWLGLAVGLGVMALVSSRAKRSGVEGSTFFHHPCRFLCSLQSVGMTIFRRFETTIKTFRISPLIFFFLISFVTLIFSGLLLSEPLSVRFGVGGWNRLEVKSVQERIGSAKEFLSLGSSLVRGVGIGQYTNTLYQNDVKKNTVRSSYAYQPVHNAFLLILAELGVVGIIPFICFLFFLGWRVCHPERNKAEYEDLVGFSGWRMLGMTKISIAALSSFIIISFFDHFFWTIHSGILLWWVVLSGLDRKRDMM